MVRLTFFECVYLFCEDAAHALFPLVDVVVADRAHQQLLQLGELTRPPHSDALRHLLVVVL